MRRRDWLLRAGAAGGLGALGLRVPPATAARPSYARVEAGRPLAFPRDFGAHPLFRTEWWYVTGWLRAGAQEIGVQITFFRSRTAHDDSNPSAFAPKQLLLAHTALAVDGEARLRHDQRAARAGLGLAAASETDTDVSIGDWRLSRTPDDRYFARIRAREFALELEFAPPGRPVAQGDAGYSRKGPRPGQASHYYSRPQLAVSGVIRPAAGSRPREASGAALSPLLAAGEIAVTGRAWLDHEWSSELLDERAVGWDWVGLNFDDGSALMAFRIRAHDGGVLWSHARWIDSPGQNASVAPASRATPHAPRFEPLRHWRSPSSAAAWPVAMRLTIGERSFELRPMFDDQELDTRASAGTIYWEGAVRVTEAGRIVGRGYLELTGYAGKLRL